MTLIKTSEPELKLNNLRAIFIFSAMLSAEEEVALRERAAIQGSCTAAEKPWVAHVGEKQMYKCLSISVMQVTK